MTGMNHEITVKMSKEDVERIEKLVLDMKKAAPGIRTAIRSLESIKHFWENITEGFEPRFELDDIFKPGNILHYKKAQEVYVMVVGDKWIKGRGADKTSFASIVLSGSLGSYKRGDVLTEYKCDSWEMSSLQEALQYGITQNES